MQLKVRTELLASENFGEVQAASVRVLRDLLAAAEAIGDQHGLFV
jgi:hypothetical protein